MEEGMRVGDRSHKSSEGSREWEMKNMRAAIQQAIDTRETDEYFTCGIVVVDLSLWNTALFCREL